MVFIILLTCMFQWVSNNQSSNEISNLLFDISIDESIDTIIQSSNFDYQYTSDTISGVLIEKWKTKPPLYTYKDSLYDNVSFEIEKSTLFNNEVYSEFEIIIDFENVDALNLNYEYFIQQMASLGVIPFINDRASMPNKVETLKTSYDINSELFKVKLELTKINMIALQNREIWISIKRYQ